MTYYNREHDEVDEEDVESPGLPAMVTPGSQVWSDLGVKPPPLRPLRYCDMRVTEGMCLRYASLELDTMAFCTYHHQEVKMALAEEERRIS